MKYSPVTSAMTLVLQLCKMFSNLAVLEIGSLETRFSFKAKIDKLFVIIKMTVVTTIDFVESIDI